jgi:type I restriction enzyme S subunit
MKPYASYKASGVDWLGDVPSHWEVSRLRFAVQFNPRPRDDLRREQNVSFLPMEAISETGAIDLELVKAVEDVSTGYTYFEDGDLTIAKITPCYENGKGAVMSGLLGGIGFGTTELIVMRPESHIFVHWLYFLTFSESFRVMGESAMYGAGGQKRVSEGFFKDCFVGIPPLAEQHAIGTYLDCETARVDALLQGKQALIALLREYRQSTISSAVTQGLNPAAPRKPSGIAWLGDVPKHWLVKRIEHVASCNDDVLAEDTEQSQLLEYVEISDVEQVEGIKNSTILAFKEAPSRARRLVKEGDILVSTVRTYLRAIAAIKDPSQNMVVSTG